MAALAAAGGYGIGAGIAALTGSGGGAAGATSGSAGVTGAVDDVASAVADDAAAVADDVANAAGSGGPITNPGNLLPEQAGPVANISPSEVIGNTPSAIHARAQQLGLQPRGPDPAMGRGAYIDPQTGIQRILSHPNAQPAHGLVNNALGQRIDASGNIVAPESSGAHLPIQWP